MSLLPNALPCSPITLPCGIPMTWDLTKPILKGTTLSKERAHYFKKTHYFKEMAQYIKNHLEQCPHGL